MDSDKINWGSGEVIFWGMTCLDEGLPINSQITNLKEDLAQVSFPNATIVDIGWYPESDPHGRFTVVAIKNGEWESPLFRADATDFVMLHQRLSEAVAIASSHSGATT